MKTALIAFLMIFSSLSSQAAQPGYPHTEVSGTCKEFNPTTQKETILPFHVDPNHERGFGLLGWVETSTGLNAEIVINDARRAHRIQFRTQDDLNNYSHVFVPVTGHQAQIDLGQANSKGSLNCKLTLTFTDL